MIENKLKMHKIQQGGVLISAYQRMIWFHNRVVEKAYPNAGTLAEQFEISNRQAQRDIEYIRDSMNAPLLYISRFFRFENVHFEIFRYNSWQMDNLFFVC